MTLEEVNKVTKYTEFGKEVKKVLVDRGLTGVWLAWQVRERTGMYFDDAYLSNLLCGRKRSQVFSTAIAEILGIPVPNSYMKGERNAGSK